MNDKASVSYTMISNTLLVYSNNITAKGNNARKGYNVSLIISHICHECLCIISSLTTSCHFHLTEASSSGLLFLLAPAAEVRRGLATVVDAGTLKEPDLHEPLSKLNAT